MRSLLRRRQGQSLIETAVLLPLLLIIVLNAINMGYFFFVYLNMAVAPRQGAEYSIQGPATILEPDYANPTDVWSLVSEGIVGAIPSSTGTPGRVCTVWNLQQDPPLPFCTPEPPGSLVSFPAPDPDPEPPLILNRVDIQYTVTPLIPGAIFNMVLPASLTFHRMVEMRAE